MNKEILNNRITTIVKNLISDHVKVTLGNHESNVFLGLVTAAGDITINGKPFKFITTYNYRTGEIKIVKSVAIKKNGHRP